MSSVEVWKSFGDNYQVSSFGNVRSIRFMKNLRGDKNNCGYLRVSIGSTKNRFFVHRLVAMLFVKGYEAGLVVNHKDSNKLNNNYENLEWVTLSENKIHSIASGTTVFKYGQNSKASRLKLVEVEEIIKLINAKVTDTEISKIYKVSRSTIRDIRRGKTWNLVTSGKLKI